MASTKDCAHVGCQGWNYADWVTPPAGASPIFYPQGTREADMLAVYARAFDTVEVDSTFYAVPSAPVVDAWHKRTPPRFRLALKLPREITHELGLSRRGDATLAEFCDHARLLDEKLAAVLVQLPPHFDASPDNLRALARFLPRLPRDLRFAVEFRHAGWLAEDVLDLLNGHNVALALVEGEWIARRALFRCVERLTADFAYVRWMGARDLTRFDTVQRPRDKNLELWASTIPPGDLERQQSLF
ncbi:MAG: DUF72 domain-containing protein [Acidobacteria bacterium]|nr:DUF72 domain-containing protein [Acidobacteriota bacterium]